MASRRKILEDILDKEFLRLKEEKALLKQMKANPEKFQPDIDDEDVSYDDEEEDLGSEYDEDYSDDEEI
jgi:hypothetical protein